MYSCIKSGDEMSDYHWARSSHVIIGINAGWMEILESVDGTFH